MFDLKEIESGWTKCGTGEEPALLWPTSLLPCSAKIEASNNHFISLTRIGLLFPHYGGLFPISPLVSVRHFVTETTEATNK